MMPPPSCALLRPLLQVRQAQKFLSKGDRVKVTLQFKGREMDHREMGQEMFQARTNSLVISLSLDIM